MFVPSAMQRGQCLYLPLGARGSGDGAKAATLACQTLSARQRFWLAKALRPGLPGRPRERRAVGGRRHPISHREAEEDDGAHPERARLWDWLFFSNLALSKIRA